MADCPKQYKNHGEESFGEGRYVTAEMLKQFCKNDSYLKGQTEDLWLEINPTSRKRFNPLPVDEDLSYGVTIPTSTDKTSRLSNSTSQNIYINFTDLKQIDSTNSTAHIESLILNDESVQRATIPKKTETTLDKTTRDYSPWARKLPDGSDNLDPNSDLTCNEFWYIGFDKSRNYELRPKWLQEPWNGEIPGVSRAQTFKAKKTGLLEAVTLNIKGTPNNYPLTVEIRNTQTIKNTNYPAGQDYWSQGNPVLATEEITFTNIDPGVYTVTFQNPVTVEQGKTYAIVLRSPLTHQTNPYYIGGWSSTCDGDIYTDGDAFLSENNGATWTRYGKPDNTVPYHYGNHAPQDFAFICHIREFDNDKYIKDTPFYLYLKPIRCNPCNSITLINPTGSGHDSDHELEFEVSTDGSDWTAFDGTGIISFEDKPTLILARAVLETATDATAPYLESFSLQLSTDAATTGYARLPYYYPPLEGVLSANVWGGLYTPYTLEADQSITDATIELISNKVVFDHYEVIAPLTIQDYTYLPELSNYVNSIEALTDESDAEQYLTDTPEVVEIFKNKGIIIIGFIEAISLSNKPAYPLISCLLSTLNDDDEDIVVNYGEFYEFITDYDENSITFKDSVELTEGSLTIQYNPVILTGLKKEDLPLRLDYLQETFIIGANDLINGEFTLKTNPNDPITKLTLNKDKELQEDIDYHIDYNNGVLVLDNLHDQGATQYKVGDELTITYTPSITDKGLSVGYKLTRTNVSYNVNVGLDSRGNATYIEYKS